MFLITFVNHKQQKEPIQPLKQLWTGSMKKKFYLELNKARNFITEPHIQTTILLQTA